MSDVRLARLDINKGLDREFLASEDARRLLERPGPDLEDGAKSRVRRRLDFLAKSIHYDVDRDAEGLYRGRLNADDFKAGWYEFGSARTPADAFLRSTAEDVIGPVYGGDK